MTKKKKLRPCRVCGETPKSYPEGRIKKSDWICTPCVSKTVAKWRSDKVRKERELAGIEKDNLTEVEAVRQQVRQLPSVLRRPKCPFCTRHMRTNRRPEDNGESVKWYCSHCDDIIRHYEA